MAQPRTLAAVQPFVVRIVVSQQKDERAWWRVQGVERALRSLSADRCAALTSLLTHLFHLVSRNGSMDGADKQCSKTNCAQHCVCACTCTCRQYEEGLLLAAEWYIDPARARVRTRRLRTLARASRRHAPAPWGSITARPAAAASNGRQQRTAVGSCVLLHENTQFLDMFLDMFLELFQC